MIYEGLISDSILNRIKMAFRWSGLCSGAPRPACPVTADGSLNFTFPRSTEEGWVEGAVGGRLWGLTLVFVVGHDQVAWADATPMCGGDCAVQRLTLAAQ